MQNIRGKMASGVVWMLLFKLVDRSIGFISTLVLARVLTPDNFGIVAMATSFIAMIELLGAFGFDMALIQRADATRSHYDTAWTFSVILGSVLCVLLLSLSIPIANFYQHPELTKVICTLAAGTFLQGFQNVGVVAFRKELDFRKEFRFLVTKKFVSFPLTIVLALVLRNYWALVIAMTFGKVFDLWFSYRMHPYRPKFCLAAAGDLLGFSRWLLFLNILQFLRDRSSDFVIGRLGGAGMLGLFSVSYELASMPGAELVAPINRAVYPAYSRLAGDNEALCREYLSVMSMICLVAIPAVAGIAATANIIVPLVLGPNWISAIPILQVLAMFGISQVMLSNAYALFLSLGRGDVFSRLNGLFVVILIALLVVLVPKYGVVGGAYAYLITALVTLPLSIFVILRTLRLAAKKYIANIWRPIVSAAIMFFLVREYSGRIASNEQVVVLVTQMFKSILLGCVIYISTVIFLWVVSGCPVSAESVVKGKVNGMWGSVRGRLRL